MPNQSNIINLFKMTESESSLIFQYLTFQIEKRRNLAPFILLKDEKITTEAGGEFQISHDLVYLNELKRFVLFDFNQEPLGQGGYGVVYESCGELYSKNKKIRVNEKNKYVVKFNKDHVPDVVYQKSSDLRYLQMKEVGQVTIKNKKYKDSAIMLKVPGISLSKFINNYKNDDSNQVMDKIDLSIKLLYQLKDIFLKRNLVHRDIKPDNIMVTRKMGEENQYNSSRIIDTDFIVNIDDKILPSGTPMYVDPDYITSKKLTDKTDVYSMGVTLAQLWGDSSEITDSQVEFIWQDLERRQFSFNDNVPDFVNDIIFKMTDNKVENRISLDNAIELFHEGRLSLIEDSIPITHRESVRTASQVAQVARDKLRTLGNSANTIKDQIYMSLEEIDDNPYALRQFQYVTNIKEFSGLKSKNEFIKKLNLVCDKFKLTDDLIEKASKLIKDKAVLSKVESIKRFRGKFEIGKHPAKLDNMKKVNDFADHIVKSNPTLKNIERVIALKAKFSASKFDENSIREKIKKSVLKYIKETLNTKNVTHLDRSLSSRRINDMLEIYNLMSLKKSENEFVYSDNNLIEYLTVYFKSPQFTTGFFHRSSLRDEVMKVINNEREIPAKNSRG